MTFLEAYKRLEKCCGALLQNDSPGGQPRSGVSAYIEAMEHTPRGGERVPGWAADYAALKRCRWLRNRIAHEPGCTEETLCRPGDAAWLCAFTDRLTNAADPLALYRKATAKGNQKKRGNGAKRAKEAPAGEQTLPRALAGFLVVVLLAALAYWLCR